MLNWLILPAILTIGLSVPLCKEKYDDVYVFAPESIFAEGIALADLLQTNVSVDAKEKIMELIHRLPKLESEADLKPILREGLQLWHGMCFNDKVTVMFALWKYERFRGKYIEPVIRAFFKENNLYDLAYTGHGDIVAHLQCAFGIIQEKLDTLYREEPEAHREFHAIWSDTNFQFFLFHYSLYDSTLAVNVLKKSQPLVLVLECTMQEVDRSNDTLIATAYNECERLIGYGFHDFPRISTKRGKQTLTR